MSKQKKLFIIGYFTIICLSVSPFLGTFAFAQNTPLSPHQKCKITVGIFVSSLYDLNFVDQKYSISGWIWAIYDPKELPEDYAFSNAIEIVNAQQWNKNANEHFIKNYSNGLRRSMTKFTATINQNWNMTHFPFDKQTLKISIESVGLDSTMVEFIPDYKNSMIRDNFNLNNWRLNSLQMKSKNYEYPTTFGELNGLKGVYPRILIHIPIERKGVRIFWTAFLGFFVSYIIIPMIIIFDDNQLSNRIGLIMSSLFASVGNKYTLDLLPTQSKFMLTDLIQVSTFAIIATGLLSTIVVIILIRIGKKKLAFKIDVLVALLIIILYPLTIYWGIFHSGNI